MACLFGTALFAQEQAANSRELSLGKIDFPTSARREAQEPFIKGVLLLHSFEYEHARQAFQQAEHIDPQFALAYWGEAMTYNHPLWNEQDLAKARQALEKLAKTDQERLDQAKTEKEKGLLNAVNILFGEGSKPKRDQAYTDAMEQLYRQNPNDDEIAALFSLALLGLHEGKQNVKTSMQAAALAEEIGAHNPEHPGALHYAIHAYDDPTHAPLGLRAARSYAKIAPDASHALHMPSHIYLALGLWDDVIASNKAAWQAGLNNHFRDVHVLQWLIYGHLQKKSNRQAYELAQTMQQIRNADPTPLAKYHYALIRAAYFTDSGDFAAELPSLDMEGAEPTSRATDLYTNAWIALNSQKKPNLTPMIDELEKLSASMLSKPSWQTKDDRFTAVTPQRVMIVKIIAHEVKALMHMQQGQIDEAIKALRSAAYMEDLLPFGDGPPLPVKPAHELLAEVLYQNGQYPEAYQEYLAALARTPNRTLAKQGLEHTEEKLKEQGLVLPQRTELYFNQLMIEK